MKQLWRIWVVLGVCGLSACGSDDASGGSTDYTQVGDVTLDGSGLGDTAGADAIGQDGSADAIGLKDSADGSGTDALADTGPAKYPDCLSLIGCVAQGCSASGWAPGCDAVCLTGASATVATEYAGVSACIENTCRNGLCSGSTDPKCIGDCIGQKCITKIAVCGADGKTGVSACGSFFPCVTACATDPNPLQCVSACYAALSPTAQTEYAAVDACTGAAGGSDAFSACPQQVLTCLAGGATGSKSCIDALSCSSVCNTGTDAQKSACMTACWSQTTADGQSAFAGAMKCEANPGSAGCADSLLACTAPNGTSTCPASLTCMQGCKQTDPQAQSTCVWTCVHDASPAEAKKNLQLQLCMGTCNCAGVKTCQDTCLTTTCKAALAACQAP